MRNAAVVLAISLLSLSAVSTVADTRSSYEQVLELFQTLLADLSEAERELIFTKNASEFYRIEDEIWSAAA